MKVEIRNNFYSGLVFMFFVFTGCDTESMGRKEMIGYLSSKKSGLIISKNVQDVSYKCLIKTAELIMLQHSEKTITSDDEYAAEVKSYGKEIQIVFTISDIGESASSVKKMVYDSKMYGMLISYANTEMSQDFEIKTSTGKIIPCSFVHLEPANSQTPVMRLTLGFRYERPRGEDLTVVFNDRIFNNGPIKFYYEKEVLDNLPKLKI